jgi:S1-C subfamily serine protease
METKLPGMLIQALIPGSPAVLAGIKPGDRLIAINGQPVNNMQDYIQATSEWTSHRTCDIMRGSQYLSLTLTMKAPSSEAPNYREIVSLLEPSDEKPN